MTGLIKKYTVAVLFSIIGLISGLGISSGLNIHAAAYSEERISKEAIDILSKMNEAMAEVTAAVKPAVVNISTTRTVKTRGLANPLFNDPFFRQFFGHAFDEPRQYKQASLGSGVIVDKSGYILTNNHVVKDADEIKIKLADGREFKGKVIGTDPKTDIAVIKINSDHLPVVKIGDSDKLRVGERVFAVGNPFGLSQTVTSGIVSATGRANVGIADYEDFIQTDAPINPGNSGGALINVRGELVGINTAIFSTSGGYQGIGFAIPSNMAKVVMKGLVTNGRIIRGWLGVSIQAVTPELAKQFGVKGENGVIVTEVAEKSPASKIGIRRGDVITGYDGKEVKDPSNLRIMVADTTPNRDVPIQLVRNGKTETLHAVIAEMPTQMQKPLESSAESFDNVFKGVHVRGITPELRQELNVPNRISGVIVSDVAEGSPAGIALAANDIIVEIDRKQVESVADFDAAASKVKSGQGVLLLVYRNGSTLYITLSPSER